MPVRADMTQGIRNWLCAHWEMTAPDDDGVAVCVKCGAAFPVVLTETLLLEQMELVRRHRYHAKGCVETDEGWCCAANCPTQRRSA